MKVQAIIAAAVVLAAGVVFGDIAPDPLITGGSSIAARNAKEITVVMTDEVVDLTPSAEKNIVTAVFTLKNTADGPATLEVGFPDFYKIALQEFAVEIDGAKQMAELKQESRKVGFNNNKTIFENWMCWPMTFEKGQERTVKVSYWVKTGVGRDDLWQRNLPEDIKALSSTFHSGYVLRTGAGWAGNIGKATINIHYGKGVSKAQVTSMLPKDGWKYDKSADMDTFVAKDFEPAGDAYNLPLSVSGSGGVTAGVGRGKPGAIGDIAYSFRLSTDKEVAAALEAGLKEKKIDPWAMDYLLKAVEQKNVLGLPKEEQAARVNAILELSVPPLGPTFKQQTAEGPDNYKDPAVLSRGAEAILEKVYDRLAKQYEAAKDGAKALALAKARVVFMKNIVDREAFSFDSGKWPKRGHAWGEYQSHLAMYKGLVEYVAKNEGGAKP